jgi:hypothetical protein
MALLKLAGITGNRLVDCCAPDRLLPFIEDDVERIADSALIRFHPEREYEIKCIVQTIPD